MNTKNIDLNSKGSGITEKNASPSRGTSARVLGIIHIVLNNKTLLLSCSFVVDLVGIFVLRALGWGIFASIAFTELCMWLVRLYFINKIIFRYILRRLFHAIPTILAVIAIAFFLLQIAPGDFFTRLELEQDTEARTLQAYREQFGIDKPWYVQFFRYITNVLRGNFGFSAEYRIPVFDIIKLRVGPTLLLSISAIIFSWGLSIPLGIFAAKNQYRISDQITSVFSFIGLAIPNFFLAFLLLYVVTTTSRGIAGTWLPIGGLTSVDFSTMNAFQQFLDLGWHLIIPVFVLGTGSMASLTRIMRANMVEVLNQQYIVTARAKGQNAKNIVFKHALRNAINPMITILGFQIASILSGAVLTEVVLSWPGLGQLVLQAILSQDTFLVMGILVYSSILLIIGNLIADILLAVSDPRVRVG